jgi:hypothetical protein
MEGREVEWRDELLLELAGSWTPTRTSSELMIQWADGRVETLPIPHE